MKKNKQIEALRGILILIIIFFHYTYRFSELFSIETINFFSLDKWGIIGVSCFFIITGYFIVPKKSEEYDMKNFIIKKILRIYPSYVLCMTIIFISVKLFGLEGRETNFIDYLLNLTMINGIINTKYVDGAHWYLTYLVIFYIVVGIILKLTKKSEVYLPIWLVVKDIIKIMTKFVPYTSIIYKLIGGNYVEFIIIGMALSNIIKVKDVNNYNIRDLLKSKSVQWYLLVIILCLLQIAIFNGKVIVVGISIFLIVLLIILLIKPKEIKAFTILYFIGDISFILYLIHQNIGYQILLGLYNFRYEFKFLYIIITLLIVICLAYIIDKFFEKRIQIIIREKLKKGGKT